jgi:hypothetical protein
MRAHTSLEDRDPADREEGSHEQDRVAGDPMRQEPAEQGADEGPGDAVGRSGQRFCQGAFHDQKAADRRPDDIGQVEKAGKEHRQKH